jgi:hypothetical protein
MDFRLHSVSNRALCTSIIVPSTNICRTICSQHLIMQSACQHVEFSQSTPAIADRLMRWQFAREMRYRGDGGCEIWQGTDTTRRVVQDLDAADRRTKQIVDCRSLASRGKSDHFQCSESYSPLIETRLVNTYLIFYLYFPIADTFFWPPLWSSGQSSWLQIQRPGFAPHHYPTFLRKKGGGERKTVVGLERGPLSLVSTTEELLDRKVAAPV